MLSNTVRLITGLNMNVVLTNERDPYYFGDHVCGKVVIENKDTCLKCFFVKISLSGTVVVRVDNKADKVADTVFNKTIPLIVDGKASTETVVWTQAANGTGPQGLFFPHGTTEFPFDFDTTGLLNCPPSHESGKGAVRWSVEALFHRPLNFDVNAKCDFRIIPELPLIDPTFSQPVKKNNQLLITGFLGAKQRGVIEAVLQVDRQGFIPGQTAHVMGTFINQCEDVVTVNSMTIKIYQSTQCTETRTRSAVATAVILNQECRSQSVTVNKGGQCPVNVDIIIPSAVPSFQHPNISVAYSVNLIVQTSKGKLEASCPFFLGSPPSPSQHQAMASAPQPYCAPPAASYPAGQYPPPSAPIQYAPPSAPGHYPPPSAPVQYQPEAQGGVQPAPQGLPPHQSLPEPTGLPPQEPLQEPLGLPPM